MITKYCSAEVIETKRTNTRIKKEGSASKFSSFDHLPEDTFREDDKYLYVKVRAISSRVNRNYDSWPSAELAGMDEDKFYNLVRDLDEKEKTSSAKSSNRIITANKIGLEVKGNYGFKTFAGRPIFVDHNNTDPTRARGVIVDSVLHVEPSNRKFSSDDYWSDPEAHDYHKPETWVELLLEIDAEQFPKLAKAFETGEIDSVSMGANVGRTICSVCDNEAQTTEDFCHHIKNKGNYFHSQKHGRKILAAEVCRDVNFFEISAVFDPADITALVTEPVKVKQKAAKRKESGDVFRVDLRALSEGISQAIKEEGLDTDQEVEKFWRKSLFDNLRAFATQKELYDLTPEEFAKAARRAISIIESREPISPKGMVDALEEALDDDLQTLYDSSLSQDDHDFLNDSGIRWSKIVKATDEDDISYDSSGNPYLGPVDPNHNLKATIYWYQEDRSPVEDIIPKEVVAEIYRVAGDDEEYIDRLAKEWLEEKHEDFIDRVDIQVQLPEEEPPTFEDHDFLNDNGIRWSKVASRKFSEYNGWSNWDTWNTLLVAENEQWSYKRIHELVRKGDRKGLEDFLLRSIIGPYNKERIQEAQEWNDIPEDERIDYRFEDLKERSPQAADIVDQLGFGADVSDEDPMIIDPALVNYDEIWANLRSGYDEGISKDDEDFLGDLGIKWSSKKKVSWRLLDSNDPNLDGNSTLEGYPFDMGHFDFQISAYQDDTLNEYALYALGLYEDGNVKELQDFTQQVLTELQPRVAEAQKVLEKHNPYNGISATPEVIFDLGQEEIVADLQGQGYSGRDYKSQIAKDVARAKAAFAYRGFFHRLNIGMEPKAIEMLRYVSPETVNRSLEVFHQMDFEAPRPGFDERWDKPEGYTIEDRENRINQRIEEGRDPSGGLKWIEHESSHKYSAEPDLVLKDFNRGTGTSTLYDKANDFNIRRDVKDIHVDMMRGPDSSFRRRENLMELAESAYLPLLISEYERWDQTGDHHRRPEAGVSKVTFFYNGYVRKVPIQEAGYEGMLREIKQIEESDIPIARSYMDGQVMVQEELKSMYETIENAIPEKKEEWKKQYPWLKGMVDGPQVGYDRGGELRAYDSFDSTWFDSDRMRSGSLKWSLTGTQPPEIEFVRNDAGQSNFVDTTNNLVVKPFKDNVYQQGRGNGAPSVIKTIEDGVTDEYKYIVSQEYERWMAQGDPRRMPEAGASKITFFYNGYTRKVPINYGGEQNILAEYEDLQYPVIPVALTDLEGLVMVQEELTSIYKQIQDDPVFYVSKYPWILWMKDGPQLGVDIEGNVKCFDYDISYIRPPRKTDLVRALEMPLNIIRRAKEQYINLGRTDRMERNTTILKDLNYYLLNGFHAILSSKDREFLYPIVNGSTQIPVEERFNKIEEILIRNLKQIEQTDITSYEVYYQDGEGPYKIPAKS